MAKRKSPNSAPGQEQLGLEYGPGGDTLRYGAPQADAAAMASHFAQSHGRSHNPDQFANIRAGESHYTSAIAVRPEYASRRPLTRSMRRSYRALTEHVNAQYEHMTKPQEQGGLGITVEVSKENPYDHARDISADVTNNRRLRVLSTEVTGGHALWSNEQNDKFRAVHDFIGHLAIGRDFSRHGEEAAYESHAATLPKEAHRALASETRAQNAYMINDPNKDFPPNAAINVPSWMTRVGQLPRTRTRKKAQGTQPELPF